MHKTPSLRPLVLALLACGSTASHAVSFTQNDVTLDINGTINGFYVAREAKSINRATGAETSTTNSALSNGLLPGWINFVATTHTQGLDIKAHISFAPGINNNSDVVGLPIGNPNPNSGTRPTPTARSTPATCTSSSATTTGAPSSSAATSGSSARTSSCPT